jgi:signal transduction histidine kinase
MPLTMSSVLIFSVFGLLAAAIVVVALYSVLDWLRPLVKRAFGSAGSVLPERLGSLRRWLARWQADDEAGDDLDDSTAALISMLNTVSIVVDESDGVVRATPDAYVLGVVDDDAIVNERVLEQIRLVRAKGGRRQFDLTTSTPERFVGLPDDTPEYSGHGGQGPAGDTSTGDTSAEGARNNDVQAVSRPNWLKVTVGRINEHFVVVLLDDVSELKRFAQLRDSFIVNVSEQLLAPERDLEQLADALERDDADLEWIRAHARQVRISSRYLSHMVSDLLLLIKAQEPVTPSESNRLDVKEQLDWVADTLAEESSQFGTPIVVSCENGLSVNGEREQIRAAVRKLVENAMAYSPKGSAVSVSAQRSKDGKQVLIRVLDRGKGIAKAEQPRVFERFYRGGNQNARSAEGIGLGLAIVKHVALTHHGSATLWSVPGQGSTFTLMLPLAC